jgi:hypothetical protein
MTEPEALQKLLLEQIARAADELTKPPLWSCIPNTETFGSPGEYI